MITKIKIENESGVEYELTFDTGNYTSYEWIEMTVDGKSYDVRVEDIVNALIPFSAKLSRDSNNKSEAIIKLMSK